MAAAPPPRRPEPLELFPFLAPACILARASLAHPHPATAALPFRLSPPQQHDLAGLSTAHTLVLLSAPAPADTWLLRYPPDLRLAIDGTPLPADCAGPRCAPGLVHPPAIEVADEPAHELTLTFTGSFAFAVAYARDISPAQLVPLLPAGPSPPRQTLVKTTCPVCHTPCPCVPSTHSPVPPSALQLRPDSTLLDSTRLDSALCS